MSAILKVLSPWETPSLQKVYKTCFLHLFQNTAFKIVLNSSWLNVEVAYTLFCKLFNLFWFVISHYVYCLNSFLTFLSLLSTFLSPQKDWVSQHKKLHLKKKKQKTLPVMDVCSLCHWYRGRSNNSLRASCRKHLRFFYVLNQSQCIWGLQWW